LRAQWKNGGGQHQGQEKSVTTGHSELLLFNSNL
jgi:hypothetical protein